jgi:hypothetical protein
LASQRESNMNPAITGMAVTVNIRARDCEAVLLAAEFIFTP